ncbi:MAG: hypothetical protein ACRC7N_15670 [Clostridium sp.]
MKFIRNIYKEMPWGRFMLWGAAVFAAMNILICLSMTSLKLEININDMMDENFLFGMLFMLIMPLLAIIIFTIGSIIPKIITLYPIAGYYLTFARGNKLLDILPLDNKQKLKRITKFWLQVLLIYLLITIVSLAYIAMLFIGEIEFDMIMVRELSTGILYFLLVSLVCGVIFSLSVIIASMIQNIYNIEKWIVIVTYIVGYIIVWIGKSFIWVNDGLPIIFMYFVGTAGYGGLNIWYTMFIYLLTMCMEVVWIVKNINRVKAR